MSDSDDDLAGPVRPTGGRNYSATPAAPLDPWEAARQEKRTIYVGTRRLDRRRTQCGRGLTCKKMLAV